MCEWDNVHKSDSQLHVKDIFYSAFWFRCRRQWVSLLLSLTITEPKDALKCQLDIRSVKKMTKENKKGGNETNPIETGCIFFKAHWIFPYGHND